MCYQRKCNKKGSEGRELILCPKCLQVKHRVTHHINPKEYFGDYEPFLYLCLDCHQKLHDLLPNQTELPEELYLEITTFFLQGKYDVQPIC